MMKVSVCTSCRERHACMAEWACVESIENHALIAPWRLGGKSAWQRCSFIPVRRMSVEVGMQLLMRCRSAGVVFVQGYVVMRGLQAPQQRFDCSQMSLMSAVAGWCLAWIAEQSLQ